MQKGSARLVDDNEIERFLHEDIGAKDLTAEIIPETKLAIATVIAREAVVVCGQAWFSAVFRFLDSSSQVSWDVSDGEEITANTRLCTVNGNARALLSGERTALNFLQTLSSTATLSRRYYKAVYGTNAIVLDTRKTIPGLRCAQKYAVRCGGCSNHRFGLFDGILIKENHIAAAGSIRNAVAMARSAHSGISVEVEVECLQELEQALAAGADRILLDNFDLDGLHRAVSVNNAAAELEASGNVNLSNIREIASTGVNYISVGALTKNIQAADLSMTMELI